MQTLTQDMSRWTTQELLDEVMRRSASDGPALHGLEKTVLRARLAESDRRFTDFGTQAELARGRDHVGVGGTLEMGLANAAVVTVSTNGGHEVDEDTTGAHTHDHTHRRVSSAKFAAHDHHHLHPDEVEADALLNGHTHARAHAQLPWERTASA